MPYEYFPGCALKNYSKDLELYSIKLAKEFGIELVELEKWNCCGVMYSNVKDDIMRKLGSIRNILRMKTKDLVVVCPMCYNTLSQVHLEVLRNQDLRTRAMNYLKEDEKVESYPTDIKIHFLFSLLAEKAKEKKLNFKQSNIKVAVYYGCTLLRPSEIAIDDPEDPFIIEEFVNRLGFRAVDWWFRVECCGAYHITTREEFVQEKVREIAEDAKANQAEIILTLCPLCHYNLKRQMILPVEYLPKFIYENVRR